MKAVSGTKKAAFNAAVWYITLRLHAVGIDGPIAFWLWDGWSPPVIGVAGSALIATLTVVVAAWAGVSLARKVPGREQPTPSNLT